MPFFRKKPVVIEAVMWTGYPDSLPSEWMGRCRVGGGIAGFGAVLVIPTLEGDHLAAKGDWIIKGVKGELYPCKPDIFAATYEPAPLPVSRGRRRG